MVLISHNHYDHLDAASLRALRARFPSVRILVPLHLGAWFGNNAVSLSELDWWTKVEHGPATFTAVPAQHWSRRSLFDRNRSLWCSWVIEGRRRRIIFVGDSGYSRDYADIGHHYGSFDLAILPIGAYAPRWFMRAVHQNPAEAVRARQDLNASRAVASHWGTFRLTPEAMTEPPLRLAAALASVGDDPDSFWLMKHGESRPF